MMMGNTTTTQKRKTRKKKKKSITSSKLVTYSFVIMFVIAFVVGTKVVLVDTSQLYGYLTFVGAPVAIIIPSYLSKSKSENTKGGIVYETAMQEMSDGVG
jgi:hypothetical protein